MRCSPPFDCPRLTLMLALLFQSRSKAKLAEGTDVEVIFLDKAEFEADRKVTIEHVFGVQEYGYSVETAAHEATAKAKLNALYPKLAIHKFSLTHDELEAHLATLDDENGVQDCIRDGRLKVYLQRRQRLCRKDSEVRSKRGVGEQGDGNSLAHSKGNSVSE